MKILILATLVASYTLEAQAVTDSLSYSGRLVQSNGAPVTGPVNLVLDLAYTNAPSTILCTQTLTSVPLSQGVFHVQYVPNCGASTLAQILQNAPTNETIAIRVTDSTNSKVYAYQAVHALPYAQVAKQVDKLGASSGQVLAWDGTKWTPTTITTNSGTYTDGSVIQADTGTAAAPSLSFQVSPSSGFYASGSNNIGVAVNGTQVFNFDSTGLSSPIAGGADIGTAAGSATAPTYSFAGDSNTGWFSPLTDALAAATGGVERIRINANGNIGVGTTSSTYRLDVQTNSSSNVMRTVSDGNKSQIDSYSYNDTATDEAQLNLLRSRGTVAAPVVVAQDDELGAVQFGGYNDAAGSFSLGASVSGAADEEWATSGDTTDAPTRLDFSTTPNGSSTRQVRMRIKENGSIGVGVLSPSALMHLAAGSMAPGSAPLKLTAGTSMLVPESGAIEYDGTNLYFTDNTGTRKALAASSGSGSLAVGSGSASSPSLSFSSDSDTGFYDSAANTIGIAAGGLQIFSMGSNGLVSATNGGGSVSTAAGSAVAPTFAFTGDEDTGWYAPLANTLAAATGGAERVRIDSSGNVGIGTTNPTNMLHIQSATSGNGILLTNSAGNTLVQLVQNSAGNGGKLVISENGTGHISLAVNSDTGTSVIRNTRLHLGSNNNVNSRLGVYGNAAIGSTYSVVTAPTDGLLVEGNVGIGTSTPTASLHLKAGTAAANTAPFKLTAGTNLTTPEAGAVEFDGTNLYYTDSTNTRKTIATGAVAAYGSGSTINAADGTAGAPSLSFANDTDTGLYDAGSNTIGVSAAGSQIFSMSSTGLVSATNGGGSVSTAAGSAAAPTFSFAGDTDTGWYAPLANTLAAATGGAERVRIDSSGNVGIGTTAPSEKLMISGGNVRVDNDYKYMFAGGGSFIQGNSGSDYILLQTGVGGSLKFNTAGANERMRIDASGNVGIGTTNPTYKLDVAGNIHSLNAGNASIMAERSAGAQVEMLAGSSTGRMGTVTNHPLRLKTNDVDRIFIDTAGKVGIGVTTPTANLHLPAGTATANTAPLKLTAGTNLTTPEAGAVEFDGTNLYYTDSTNTRKTLATGAVSAYGSGSTINAADGTAGAPSLSFANDTDTGLYDAGSNTIGVSAGGSQIFSMSSTGLVSATNGGGSVSTAAGSAAAPTFSFAGDTDTGWYAPLANTLAAATGGVERVRIDSSGNMGFGTNSPDRPVHIASSSAPTILLENTGSSADARRKYITSTANSFAIGKLTDDMSTATEHLRIDNSGNIGIGTTNPSYLVHVSGGTLAVDSGAGSNTFVLRDGSVSKTAGDFFSWNTGIRLNGTNGRQLILGATTVNNSKDYSIVSSSKLSFFTNGYNNESLTLSSTGQVGVGTTSPTGRLHLPAGSATASSAPLKFTAGTNLTTPEAGAVEFDGTNLYYTDSTNTRKTIATGGSAYSSGSTINAADGTAGAPSLSFANDSDTGLYDAGANTIGVSAGGSQIFSMSSTGLVSATNGGGSVSTAAGSAAAPTFSFAGDTDTGWYAPLANTLAAATGGVERVRIDSSGNMGFGTNSPVRPVHIASSSAPTVLLENTGNTADARRKYITSTADSLSIGKITDDMSTATEHLRINNSGYVGIGTTNPTTLLTVTGQSSMLDSDSIIDVRRSTGTRIGYFYGNGGNGMLRMQHEGASTYTEMGARSGSASLNLVSPNSNFLSYTNGANTWSAGLPSGLAEYQVRFGTTPVLHMTTTGNVGISTTAPTARFQLPAGAAAANKAPLKFTAGTNLTTPEAGAVEFDGTYLYYTDSTNTRKTLATGAVSAYGSGSTLNAADGTAAAPSLSFANDSDTGLYDAGANTIGVSAGGSQIFSMSSSGLVSSTAGGGSVSTAAGTAAAPTYAFSGDTDTGWYSPAANTLAAATGASERIRIDSSGNIGIGTTAPAKQLDIVGNEIGLTAPVDSTTKYGWSQITYSLNNPSAPTPNKSVFAFGAEGYYSNAGVLTGGNFYIWDESNAKYRLSANTSGDVFIAGNQTSSTGAGAVLTAKGSGNVGIGTTAPNRLLEVSGANGMRVSYGSGSSGIEIKGNQNSIGYINFQDYANSNNNGYIQYSNTTATTRTGGINTMVFGTNQLDRMVINGSGNVGIGTTAPTALLTLKAGTASANTAPLKFTAGTNLTTPEAGAVEFDGTNLFITDSTNTRRTIATGSGLYGSGSTITAADGTAAAPSLSFANDSDTGFYDSGTNSIGVAAGGSQIFNMSSAGLVSSTSGGGSVSTAAGTAAAPTFSFSGDTDTGWYAPAANTLAAATGASERVRIDSSGNVGIGTTNPTTSLHVVRSANTDGQIMLQTNASTNTIGVDLAGASGVRSGFVGIRGTSSSAPNTQYGFYNWLDSNNPMIFGTNNAERMRIDGTGQVGVGTTAPQTKMHLYGGVSTDGQIRLETSTSSSTVGIDFNHTAGRRGFIGLRSSSSSSPTPSATFSYYVWADNFAAPMIFGTQATERMRIDSLGYVGIGTTAPTSYLTVRAGTASIAPFKLTAGTSLTTPESGAVEYDGTNLYFTDSTATRRTIATSTSGSMSSISSISNASGNIAIQPNSLSGTVTVGPGAVSTSSSTGTLVVSGDQGVTGSINVGSTVMTGAGSATAPSLTFGSDTDTGWYAPLANTLAAATGGTERIRINSSGYVGLGTTAPTALVDVAFNDLSPTDGLFRITDTGASSGYIKFDDSTTSATQFAPKLETKSIGSTRSFTIENNSSAANDSGTTPMMVFNVSATGTVANRPLYSFQNNGSAKMTILPSGKVGIGNTNPQSMLQVGASYVTQSANFSNGINLQHPYYPMYTAHGLSANAVSGGYVINDETGSQGAGSTYSWATQIYSVFNNFSGGIIGFMNSGSERMRIANNGNVGIGTTSPGQKLEVNGSVKATSFISTSDRRLKRDIATVNGLEVIDAIQGVSWQWKDSTKKDAGVIAQDVEKVFPTAVVTDPKSGLKSVNYGSLLAPVIEAIKDLHQLYKDLSSDVEDDREMIKQLVEENKRLRSDMNDLKKQMNTVDNKCTQGQGAK